MQAQGIEHWRVSVHIRGNHGLVHSRGRIYVRFLVSVQECRLDRIGHWLRLRLSSGATIVELQRPEISRGQPESALKDRHSPNKLNFRLISHERGSFQCRSRVSAERLAELFHHYHETLAPDFGCPGKPKKGANCSRKGAACGCCPPGTHGLGLYGEGTGRLSHSSRQWNVPLIWKDARSELER